jgi:pimeloyl-ACP methyl ester carboxylesterase
MPIDSLRKILVALAAVAACGATQAAGTVGNTLPANFPVIEDTSLGKPVIGFGAAGTVSRTPVIFLHGNNDTPFATLCNPYGRMQALAQYLADNGYATSELWGLGYQGDQCDLPGDPTLRSRIAHTNAANVPDLRRFVRAVLAYTGAREVDIVGHSLGVTLAREWMRQDNANRQVRRFVAIDGPNQGIINCSPSAANYWQAAANGGFTPDSAVCEELGSPHTPFLQLLNGRGGENEAPTRVLVIRNADTSFVYFPLQDGFIAPVPAIDSFGQPTDFSRSARLRGAREIALTGQGAFDPILGTGHLGILNSPATWAATLDFLVDRNPHR